VEKILEFDEHDVQTIMTPRQNIFALPDNMSVQEALPLIEEQGYSRIPIYHERIDNIIGVLKVQSLVSEYLKEDFQEKNIANLSLIKPLKVPLTMKLNVLLKDIKQEKIHMAFVYNEHGGFIGLITLEDILEEVFGEFEDEEDEHILQIRRTGKQQFECHADIELEQIEDFLGRMEDFKLPHNWPWTREEENKTLSYFLLEQFGHFPEVQETIKLKEDGRIFEFVIVSKTKEEKIERVILKIQ
jgi:putative hemolysin